MSYDTFYQMEVIDIENKYTEEELNRLTFDVSIIIANLHDTRLSKMARTYNPNWKYDFKWVLDDEQDWDEDEEEMINISNEYPDVLFALYGDGEESDDYWVKYFYKGKMSGGDAEIVYPAFDLKKHMASDTAESE